MLRDMSRCTTTTVDGRILKLLNVVDEYTPPAHAAEGPVGEGHGVEGSTTRGGVGEMNPAAVTPTRRESSGSLDSPTYAEMTATPRMATHSSPMFRIDMIMASIAKPGLSRSDCGVF